MTVKQRMVLLNRAMPSERWSDLRQRMAGMTGLEMTPVQQEALGDIIDPVKNYGARPTRRTR
jgi:hypothetical protein